MPTTLSSPVDWTEFRFVAVDAAGEAWRWVDEEMVWLRLADRREMEIGLPEKRGRLH